MSRSRRLIIVCVWALHLTAAAADERTLVRVATTTTTDNSGLIEILIPAFEAKTNYSTRVVAVGTGKALRLLANGDVDVALTHARALEMAVLKAGHGINRRPVMYNDFVVVGPPDDPAAIRDAVGVDDAFRRISDRQWIFVSRGDESGTHARESSIWIEAGIEPRGEWYRDTGQGMGHSLQIAAELNGYTLTDRATWLTYQNALPMRVLFQGDERLLNVYSVVAANPDRHADANHAGAAAFTKWLLSSDAAGLIAGLSRHGQQLFVPLLPIADE